MASFSSLTENIIRSCHEVGIKSVVEFLNLDTEILVQKINLTYKDVSVIKKTLFSYYLSRIKEGETIYREKIQHVFILDTGCLELNFFLKGGIYSGEITEVQGLPKCGKTQLSLSILANLVIETGNTAIYIDALAHGGFPAFRLEQIFQYKNAGYEVIENSLKRVRVINVRCVYDVLDVLAFIKEKLDGQGTFFASLKLIVLDSIGPLIAPKNDNTKSELQGLTFTLAQDLKCLCSDYSLSILFCSNLVQGKHFAMKPAFGYHWQCFPSVILRIQFHDDEIRNSHSTLRNISMIKNCRKSTFGNICVSISEKGIISAS